MNHMRTCVTHLKEATRQCIRLSFHVEFEHFLSEISKVATEFLNGTTMIQKYQFKIGWRIFYVY